VVRLAVNGTADDISLWEQMQDRPARRDARADPQDDEAELRASLRALGYRLEDEDGQ